MNLDPSESLGTAPPMTYPWQTRMGVALAISGFAYLAAWILCEQYCPRNALVWGFHDNPYVAVLPLAGLVLSTFATPWLLVWGVFRMPRDATSLGAAVRPFLWHLGLALSGLSLPWIYSQEFRFGAFWTMYVFIAVYAIALGLWTKGSRSSPV